MDHLATTLLRAGHRISVASDEETEQDNERVPEGSDQRLGAASHLHRLNENAMER